jgi:hypothetical protein
VLDFDRFTKLYLKPFSDIHAGPFFHTLGYNRYFMRKGGGRREEGGGKRGRREEGGGREEGVEGRGERR